VFGGRAQKDVPIEDGERFGLAAYQKRNGADIV
jgi:hypothetical protein